MENWDKLAICAALGCALLELMGFKGFGGLALAIVVMWVFDLISRKEVGK